LHAKVEPTPPLDEIVRLQLPDLGSKVSAPGDRTVRQRAAARPTVKQHLAAIRMLFDWLIVGKVLAINCG
jgi:hypothetical protein